MKVFFKNGLLVLCSLLLTLLAAEGVLHFFPVNEGLHVQPVNKENPIIHFEPNRTSTWSRFADFSMVNTVHSNNYGFINNQDYDPNGKLPLIAIIGDSYVEAAMVPYGETMHGRLADALKGKYRVYSFGVSGAPLSQYLAFAQFVREEFKPGKMIFVIAGNDFDESLLKYKNTGGFHYFTGNGPELELQRVDLQPRFYKQLLRKSRLAMYLITNAQVTSPFKRNHTGSKIFVGQTNAQASKDKISHSKQATDAFLTMLPEASGLAPKDICIVVDGARPHLYSKKKLQKAQGNYF